MRIKLFVVIYILITTTCFGITKTNKTFDDYYSFVVVQNDYRYSKNWKQITNDKQKIVVYYKISSEGSNYFISEINYVLIKEKQLFLLGGFNKEKGFFDSNGSPLYVDDGELKFYKNYLLGISINSLRSPFSLKGIAKTTDGKMIYETEILKRLKVNEETLKIEEYFPDF